MCAICESFFVVFFFIFFNDTATTEIYTLSLHDALPIYAGSILEQCVVRGCGPGSKENSGRRDIDRGDEYSADHYQTAGSHGERRRRGANSTGVRDQPASQANHHDPFRRRHQPADVRFKQSPREHFEEAELTETEAPNTRLQTRML